MTDRRKRDPIFAAAVLKLTFQARHEEQSPQFRSIYEGVLRDLGVEDADVDAYLAAHRAQVELAIAEHGGRARAKPGSAGPGARRKK